MVDQINIKRRKTTFATAYGDLRFLKISIFELIIFTLLKTNSNKTVLNNITFSNVIFRTLRFLLYYGHPCYKTMHSFTAYTACSTKASSGYLDLKNRQNERGLRVCSLLTFKFSAPLLQETKNIQTCNYC